MGKLHALVMDNDISYRTQVQKLLEKSGFTVAVTSLGNESLALAKQSRFNLVCYNER